MGEKNTRLVDSAALAVQDNSARFLDDIELAPSMSNHASMRSSADARSYSAQAGKYEDGDVIVGENERVVCVERLQTQTQEQPVVVYEEHLQERTANVTKPVTRTTVTERPVITPIRKTIQIVREVMVFFIAYDLICMSFSWSSLCEELTMLNLNE